MGEFGQINYGMPVPASGFGAVEKGLKEGAAAFAAADEAQIRYIQGVLKSEAAKANTHLGKKLLETNTMIKETPYVTREDVRKGFQGEAWDALPDSLKKEVDAPVDNPDDPGIPMWKLAPHIFDKVAREATDKSAEMISAPGWQKEFRNQALGEVAVFKARMQDHQFESFKSDSRLSEKEEFTNALNAQRWEYADFVAGKMSFHSPAEREQLKGLVRMEKEKAPLNAAILSQSPAEVSLALADLAQHPENYANIPLTQQRVYAAQLQQHQTELATQSEAQRKAMVVQNDKLVWDQLLKAEQDGRPLTIEMAGRPGELLDPAEIRSRMEYIRKVQSGEHINTDPAVMKALMDQQAYRPEDFAKENLNRYRLRLSKEDFNRLQQQQLGIRKEGITVGKTARLKDIQEAKMDFITSTFDLDPKKPEDLIKIHQYEQFIDQGIDAFRANNQGTDPNRAQVLGIASQSLGDKTEGTLYGTNDPALKATMKGLPLVVGSNLADKLKSEGTFVTPERMKTEIENYKIATPAIIKAWERWAPGDALSEGTHVDIYRRMTDPASREDIDRNLRAAGVEPTDAGRLQYIITAEASRGARIEAQTATQQEEFDKAAATAVAEVGAVRSSIERAADRERYTAEFKPAIEELTARKNLLLAELEDINKEAIAKAPPAGRGTPAFQLHMAEKRSHERELERIEVRLRKMNNLIEGKPQEWTPIFIKDIAADIEYTRRYSDAPFFSGEQ